MSRRIYLDARNITASPAGVGRYAQSLIPQLVRLAPDDRFVVIRHASNRAPILPEPDPRLTEVFVDHAIGKLADFALGVAWLHEVFRTHGHPDLYHNLFHVTPLGLGRLGAYAPRVVVTLHDLIWLDHPIASQGTLGKAAAMWSYARLSIPATLARADHVVCISEPTAARARRWLRDGAYSVIPHGVDASFFEPPARAEDDAIRAWIEAPQRYVIAVGNDKKYKNLELLMDAFVHPDVPRDARLMLVGPCERLRPLISEHGLDGRVMMPGFLSREDLNAALAGARAFCFPSLVEGFGLPPLEAMALGTPAIVSDVEPMRSIVADGAELFDPSSTAQLAAILGAVLTDDALHDDMVARGLARASTFSWETTAARTLEAYDAALR